MEREGGEGWIERSEFGVSRVIRPCYTAEEKTEASGEKKGGCKGRYGRKDGGK